MDNVTIIQEIYILSLLLALSIVDYKKKHVSLLLMIFLMLPEIILCCLQNINFSQIAVAIVTGFILIFLSKKFHLIGEADVIIFIVIYLSIGEKCMLLTLMFSSLLASISSIFQIIYYKKSPKDKMAFIPYVFLGNIISLALYL